MKEEIFLENMIEIDKMMGEYTGKVAGGGETWQAMSSY